MEKFPEQMANLNRLRQQIKDGTFKPKPPADPVAEMKPYKGPYNKAELDATCRLLKDLLDKDFT
jgi:hypothetical protein